jgi:hypothetical protein
MEAATTIERCEVQLPEIHIRPHVTLVQMPDMITFDLHVYGDAQYLVHFLNPHVFGMEFAIIRKGYNLFTQVAIEQETKCRFYDDVRLRHLMAAAPTPKTPPIIIPPRPNPKQSELDPH